MTTVLLLLLAAAVVTGLALALRRRGGRRQRAMTQVLDAADALEERLRTARSEIEAIVAARSPSGWPERDTVTASTTACPGASEPPDGVTPNAPWSMEVCQTRV